MTILNDLDNEATRALQASKIMNLEMDDIEPNPLNTAPMNYLDELEELVKENGVIEPIVVYKVANHQYRLLAGERRFTVAGRLNYESIPAVIVDKPNDDIEEMLLIALYNVQRPDDTETMREKILSLKTILEKKRERGDEDVKNVRSTEWISSQLSGLSARTVQEYLTGKYSEQHVENLVSELDEETQTNEPKPKKTKTLKAITKQMEKLRRELESLDLTEGSYSRKDLIDFEYESSECFMYFSRNGTEITRAKRAFDDKRNEEKLQQELDNQMTVEDFLQ